MANYVGPEKAMCQCAQRRIVIRQALAGQLAVGEAVQVVTSTVAQDVRAMRSSALAAAKSGLARLRR